MNERQEVARVQAILDKVRYKDWCPQAFHRINIVEICWGWFAPCVNSGEAAYQESRHWNVTGQSEEQIVRTAFAAAKMAEEHECAEHFLYENRRVFDPHKAVL